jgi:hypothetical protein
MSHLTRRGLLIGGATVAAVALQPEIAHATAPTSTHSVRFTLNATVLDGGEQVTSLTLDTSDFGMIDPASLTTSTFKVHAKATNPIPVAPGDLVLTEYDLDRVVTGARIEHDKIILDLATTDQVTGGGTLAYLVNEGRNVLMTLVYTITQTAPLKLRNRGSLMLPGFTQGKLADPEVDAYSYHKSADGMNYRLFSPTQGAAGSARPVAASVRSSCGCTVAVKAVCCRRTTTTTNRCSERTAALSGSRRPRPRRSSTAPTSSPRRRSRTGWKTDLCTRRG